MKKRSILFVVLFSIILISGNVNAQCVIPPCDCDGDLKNTSAGGCTCAPCDCDDGDPAVWNLITCYPDCDNDSHGDDTSAGVDVCEPNCAAYTVKCNGFDYVPTNWDCDDSNDNVYPGAAEKCDGVDNQCPPNGQCDEGCDDDRDDYCDWTMGYVPHGLNDCRNRYGPGFCGARPDSECDCDKKGDCDDSEADDVFPGSTCTAGDDDCTLATNSQCAECIHPWVAEVCDWVDNDCDTVYDDVCPMVPPEIEIWDDTGVLVVPTTQMVPCTTSGWDVYCKYDVRSNPGAFKEEGDFTINVTWDMPVGDFKYLVITVSHDNSPTACNCFYSTECKGLPCWVAGEYVDASAIGSDMEGGCCGDDADENFVGGTDGTYACCDNKDAAGVDLGDDECVIATVCQDMVVGVETNPNIHCDGVDNDCDGLVDEICGCDSAKIACDRNESCPNFRCNDTDGSSKSCWKVGGDSNPTGATACCGLNDTFPDTPNEFYIWNPCDGTDACCDQAGECVLKGICQNRLPQPESMFPCDGIDNDCDCLIDEFYDKDNDSVSECGGDCDDNDPMRYPGNWERCGDGIDQDCDGEDLVCGKPEDITMANLCRLVYDISYILIPIAASITVLLMVIGGLRLIGSDNPENASKAKNMIKNAIIGLIMVIALIGIGHMYVPRCVPSPGSAYSPPSRYGEAPLVVTIINPKNEEFFVEGQNVGFDAHILGGYGPFNLIWDFGDGTPTPPTAACGGSVSPVVPLPCPGPAHAYVKGNYTAKVTVVDSTGEKAWDRVKILVGIMLAEIDFPLDGDVIESGDTTDLNATVKGGVGPYTYEWRSDIDGVIDPAMCAGTSVGDYYGCLLSDGEHVITFTVTDSDGRVASDSIYLSVLSDVPNITAAQSCWKQRTGSEDETIFRFNISLQNAGDLTVDVAVVETGECTWPLDCCDFDTPLYRPESHHLGPVAASTPVTVEYINFCMKSKKLEIVAKANGDKWTFCACCNAEKRSDKCPGNYGDSPPHDFYPCEVYLGSCSTLTLDELEACEIIAAGI